VGRVLIHRKDTDAAFKEEDFLQEAAASPEMAVATPPTRAFGAGVPPFRNIRRSQ
jgi:hypothetical protein